MKLDDKVNYIFLGTRESAWKWWREVAYLLTKFIIKGSRHKRPKDYQMDRVSHA